MLPHSFIIWVTFALMQCSDSFRIKCRFVGRASHLCSSHHLQSGNVPTRSTVKNSESGAALELKGVNLCIGSNDIISDINWNIMSKERWALVGKNGAGLITSISRAFSNHINKFPLFLQERLHF